MRQRLLLLTLLALCWSVTAELGVEDVDRLVSAAAGNELRRSANENDIVGTPRVFCGEDGVKFEIETRLPFTGKIYARNEYYRDTCRSNFDQLADHVKLTKGGEFRLNFNECGVKRERTIAPVRGMAYSVTMVVQFHPTFVTGADRAFDVRCFYRERTIQVNAGEIDVDPLATELMHIDHPTPRCSYTIRHQTANGPLATFARVGDPIVHVFACDNDAGTYNILVRDCQVEDGKTNARKLIDNVGCTQDAALITTPEYAAHGLLAYATATVFKWPDESAVYFSCQLTLCMKADDQCSRLMPPRCDESGLTLRRLRRSAAFNDSSGESIEIEDEENSFSVDLQVRRLLVLERDEKIDPALRQVSSIGDNGNEAKLRPIVNFSTAVDTPILVEAPIFIDNESHETIDDEQITQILKASDQSTTGLPNTSTAMRTISSTPATQPATTSSSSSTTTTSTSTTTTTSPYWHPSSYTQEPIVPVNQPPPVRTPVTLADWLYGKKMGHVTPDFPAIASELLLSDVNEDIVQRAIEQIIREREAPSKSEHESIVGGGELATEDATGSVGTSLGRVCYGLEYVIGFGVLLALFVFALTVVTIRLIWPLLRSKWGHWRKRRSGRNGQTAGILEPSRPVDSNDNPLNMHLASSSRLNVRYASVGGSTGSVQPVPVMPPNPPVPQYSLYPPYQSSAAQ